MAQKKERKFAKDFLDKWTRAEREEGPADEALQIHGGWGYLTDFEVERMWRNAKLGEIGAGTNEIRQLLIARELFGMR